MEDDSGLGSIDKIGGEFCQPLECFLSAYRDQPIEMLMANTHPTSFKHPVPRVELVLLDQSRKEPHYVGEWRMFLPSDVILGGTIWRFIYYMARCGKTFLALDIQVCLVS